MRLFILSLLALGAHGHSIAYQANLQAYAPARGEFAVESGRAQGYVRYLDANGAERLVPYYYPEPLYGLRRLSYTANDAVHPLLRSSQKPMESVEEQNALFRAWCEQRYNALKLEIDRLRSEGKTPSSNILAQFEPLEKIVKAAAYDIVPGLSPEIQRARDEQLRIWNEARLKVLQAEEEQMRLYGAQSFETPKIQNLDLQTRIGANQESQPNTLNGLFRISDFEATKAQQPAQEVKPAKEEHLKLLSQEPNKPDFAPAQPQIKYSPIQVPQPVQDTPEVIRAREEHLKLLNEAKLKSAPIEQQPYGQSVESIQPTLKYTPGQEPVQDTPEVIRAREEHLRLFEQDKLKAAQAQQNSNSNDDGSYRPEEYSSNQESEQQPKLKAVPGIQQPIASLKFQPLIALKSTSYEPLLQQVQDTPEVIRAREEHLRLVNEVKSRLEDRIADDTDRLHLLERENEAERMRELELRREQEKLDELERLREVERKNEEKRLLEAELLALELEEKRRKEMEAAEEQKYKTDLEMQSLPQPQIATKFIIQPQQQQPQQVQQQAQQHQLQQNGFFLRIQANQPQLSAVASSIPGASAYLIGGQPASVAAAPLFIPAKNENPFFLRYTQAAQPIKQETKAQPTIQRFDNSMNYKQHLHQHQHPKPKSEIKSDSPLSTNPAGISNTLPQSSLSDLDKATREHFRAHEIALEQLRLANLKNPWNPDCN